ncbi:MAG: hypothetical protein HQL88_01660 [Magnetococcales bacterium]|nr:hypothetical protein [Magnetococcales bacterium]
MATPVAVPPEAAAQPAMPPGATITEGSEPATTRPLQQPTALPQKAYIPLATILGKSREESHSRHAVMMRLFSLWGISAKQLGNKPNCNQAALVGLACADGSGDWESLRQLDVPVILTLDRFDQTPRYALLTALGHKRATLRFARREETLPLSEVERYWQGAFQLLWRLPPGKSTQLRVGTQGAEILWLRQRLDRIQPEQGKPATPELFDPALAERLRTVQSRLLLPPDGQVAWRTFMALDFAIADPERPLPALGHIKDEGEE